MASLEFDPGRDALAELHVELRLDEALRAMALADIKAPLMDVALSASAAERLVGASADPRLREAIRDIRESAARATSLLAGLADETSPAIDLRVTEVSELIATCVRAVQPLARARAVRVEVRPTPGETRALCDKVRAVRAVVTLLSVALRRSREGGAVELGVIRSDGELRVTVTDTGPSLEDDAIEALLSPVIASEEGLPTRDLGRARRAAAVQGGHLRIYRQPQGMAFEIQLSAPTGRSENFTPAKPF